MSDEKVCSAAVRVAARDTCEHPAIVGREEEQGFVTPVLAAICFATVCQCAPASVVSIRAVGVKANQVVAEGAEQGIG